MELYKKCGRYSGYLTIVQLLTVLLAGFLFWCLFKEKHTGLELSSVAFGAVSFSGVLAAVFVRQRFLREIKACVLRLGLEKKDMSKREENTNIYSAIYELKSALEQITETSQKQEQEVKETLIQVNADTEEAFSILNIVQEKLLGVIKTTEKHKDSQDSNQVRAA